jgi:hypothetical protein
VSQIRYRRVLLLDFLWLSLLSSLTVEFSELMVVSSMQHHPHHSQGPAPPQHLQQHPRPSSIVQHHHQAPSAQPQHPPAYSSHSIQPYQGSSHSASAQHSQDIPYYAHQSPYSTPGTTSGYTSAGKSFDAPRPLKTVAQT